MRDTKPDNYNSIGVFAGLSRFFQTLHPVLMLFSLCSSMLELPLLRPHAESEILSGVFVTPVPGGAP